MGTYCGTAIPSNRRRVTQNLHGENILGQRTEDTDKDNRFETMIAILIALVTVTGAIVAWRASVAADGAGDADFAGLQASTRVEETRALNFVNAYEQYRAFVQYKQNLEFTKILAAEIKQQGENPDESLVAQLSETLDLASAQQELFSTRFVSRDGSSYDLQRQLGQMWAEAAKANDLNPDPQYSEADFLRNKTNLLLLSLTVLALSLVFFTLTEAFDGTLKVVMFIVGLLIAFGGVVSAVYVEFILR
jgi:hypothetical protein